MDNGLHRRKDAIETPRQCQTTTRISRCGSDSKPEGYYQQFLTGINEPVEEQLLDLKMLEENEAQ